MNEGASILAIGDVHLGAPCSGVPRGISSWGVDPGELTPVAALRRSVDFAIRQRVDAVLFAGDVVESINAGFEAMLPLEESVRQLLEAGIEVIAVAGNHDVEALPRLAAAVDGFTLLGAGGRWEARTISKDGSPAAQVVGWSFDDRFVRQSPVAELLREPLETPPPPVPRIGLLHADLDAPGGHDAPIRQAEIDQAGCDAWLLGHVHQPSLERSSTTTEGRFCGYLGSLVGLDSSETGPHGPWLLTVAGDGGMDLRQIPLAPLRWEQAAVSVEGLDHVEDLPDRLLSEAERVVGRLGEHAMLPRALGLRVQLTGTAAGHDRIRRWIAGGEWTSMGRNVDGTAVFFSKVVDSMDLPLDLAETASGDDAAALMAQRLVTLMHDDGGSRTLLEEARAALSETAGEDVWLPVQDHRNAPDPLSDEALRDLLLRSGKAALRAMLTGREESGPS